MLAAYLLRMKCNVDLNHQQVQLSDEEEQLTAAGFTHNYALQICHCPKI